MRQSRGWWTLERVFAVLVIGIFGSLLGSAWLSTSYPLAWDSFWFDVNLSILQLLDWLWTGWRIRAGAYIVVGILVFYTFVAVLYSSVWLRNRYRGFLTWIR